MLRIWLLLIILCAGFILGPMIVGNQGYVLMQTNNYTIETSVTGLILMITLLVTSILLTEGLIRRVWHTGARTHRWLLGRKRTTASKTTRLAMLKWLAGDYLPAEKLFTRHIKNTQQPTINYLLAADAAEKTGNITAADRYLLLACEQSKQHPDQLPEEKLALDILRIRILLAQGETGQACERLNQLLVIQPQHPQVLKLAEQAYQRNGTPGSLLDILPAMRKIRLYDSQTLTSLEQTARIHLMQQAVHNGGSTELKQWWQQQNRKTRDENKIKQAVIKQFLALNDHEAAQNLLLEGLKRQPDPSLLALIPQVHGNNQAALEKWLQGHIKKQGISPQLNKILGRLLQNQKQWQPAFEALSSAVKTAPDPESYVALADVLDQLQRPQQAAQVRNQALQAALGQTPMLDSFSSSQPARETS